MLSRVVMPVAATVRTPLLFRTPSQDACTPRKAAPSDVVEVEMRRPWLTPWKCEPSASVVNKAGKVPLDIDEVAGVTGRLLGHSPLGPAITCSLLLLGAYFSAASAGGACHLYIDLNRRREGLRRQIAAIDAHLEVATDGASLEAWRKVCVRDEAIAARRQWLQVPCMIGGCVMAASILCNEALLGRWSPWAARAGAALVWAGAPAMIAFATGTGFESIASARAQSTRALAQTKSERCGNAEPWATAAKHTEARGAALFAAHVITACSGFVMAAGLAVIYGVGPIGLVGMLPGLVGMQVGMRRRQRHTETQSAAGDIARLVHTGSSTATAERLCALAAAQERACNYLPSLSDAVEMKAVVGRVMEDELFEHWAFELGRSLTLRHELGEARSRGIAFDAQRIAAHDPTPDLQPALEATVATTYAGAGVDRLQRIARVLMDFYIEQLRLEGRSAA